MIYIREKIKKSIENARFLDRVCSIYLFGSFARDEQNNDSDIDLLLIHRGWSSLDKREFRKYLSKQLCKDVSILSFNESQLPVLIRENKLLFYFLKDDAILMSGHPIIFPSVDNNDLREEIQNKISREREVRKDIHNLINMYGFNLVNQKRLMRNEKNMNLYSRTLKTV